jgi:uncharacterized protein YyaL (SSP411 family)
MRSWHSQTGARTPAFAADYAALVDAFVRLAEATGEKRWITHACETADSMLELFWDQMGSGLLTTGNDGERLAVEMKDVLDNATPSANSSAAWSLIRLAALTGSTTYEQRALEIVRLVAAPLRQQPAAFAFLLGALDLMINGATEIVVTGDRPDLVSAVQGRYLPYAVLAWGDPWPSPLWDDRADGLAYVCEHFSCKAPVATPEQLSSLLER